MSKGLDTIDPHQQSTIRPFCPTCQFFHYISIAPFLLRTRNINPGNATRRDFLLHPHQVILDYKNTKLIRIQPGDSAYIHDLRYRHFCG